MTELLAVVRLLLRFLHQCKNAGGACQCVLQFRHNRAGQTAVKCRLLAVLHELLVDLRKTSGSALFIAKGLDNGLTAHHLVDQRGLSAAHFTLLLEQTIRTAGDKAGDKKAQRGQHNDHQRNPEIFGEHENQRHQNGHDTGKQLGKSEQ